MRHFVTITIAAMALGASAAARAAKPDAGNDFVLHDAAGTAKEAHGAPFGDVLPEQIADNGEYLTVEASRRFDCARARDGLKIAVTNLDRQAARIEFVFAQSPAHLFDELPKHFFHGRDFFERMLQRGFIAHRMFPVAMRL